MTKERKQKLSLDRILKQSFRKQSAFKRNTERENFERFMKWNKEHLSPNGGKFAWGKSKDEKKDN